MKRTANIIVGALLVTTCLITSLQACNLGNAERYRDQAMQASGQKNWGKLNQYVDQCVQACKQGGCDTQGWCQSWCSVSHHP